MAKKTATDTEETKTKTKKSAKKTTTKAAKPSNAHVADYGILSRPLITEKSTAANAENTYVFYVNPRATKTEIRGAVERVFSVQVSSVRTANSMGKIKRIGRSIGRRAKTKKAYVTLKEGSSIQLVEGV